MYIYAGFAVLRILRILWILWLKDYIYKDYIHICGLRTVDQDYIYVEHWLTVIKCMITASTLLATPI